MLLPAGLGLACDGGGTACSGLWEEGGDIASVRIEWGGCVLPAGKPAEGNPGHPGGGGGQGTQQGQEALADVGDEVYDDDLNCFVSSSTLKYVNK